MICYQDKTFCGSDCVNKTCGRHFTDETLAAARRWWGSKDAPISFSNFSKDCPDYQGPVKSDEKISLQEQIDG